MSKFEMLGGQDYVPFVTDIQVKDCGQTVIIYCTASPEKDKNYIVFCLECEKVELAYYEKLKDRFFKDGVIDVIDSSIMDKIDKLNVYLYGGPVRLDLICKDIKVEKQW